MEYEPNVSPSQFPCYGVVKAKRKQRLPFIVRARAMRASLSNIPYNTWKSAGKRENDVQGVVDLLSQQAPIDLIAQHFKQVTVFLCCECAACLMYRRNGASLTDSYPPTSVAA
jgi:hypothetical protein